MTSAAAFDHGRLLSHYLSGYDLSLWREGQGFENTVNRFYLTKALKDAVQCYCDCQMPLQVLMLF